MKFNSIRTRLAVWYALILMAVFAATGLGIRYGIEHSIDQTLDRELRARLAAMHDFMRRQANDPEAGTLVEELAEEDAITPAGAQFRVASADGHWIYQSTGAKHWDQRLPQETPERIETWAVSGRRVRVLTARVDAVVVQIGMPLDAFDAMLKRLSLLLMLASPAVLLLASAGGYWMSGRALSPVARIVETAEAIQVNELSRRLPLRGSGDELDRLSATLNAMFDRLEAAFERMRQFTADASHELRTPVAIIRATAELARSRRRTVTEYERSLAQIETAGERASRLIDDLMMLARADGGREDDIREPVDVAEPLTRAVDEIKTLSQAKGVSLDCLAADGCVVDGDSDALRRLFLILLDNAVKYNREGGHIRVALACEPTDSVSIEVRDTGIGIAVEHLPHLFERFYRAAPDRSRATGGAGLGLAIARQIARRHGGDISVESAPGHGSTFRVRLPGTR